MKSTKLIYKTSYKRISMSVNWEIDFDLSIDQRANLSHNQNFIYNHSE